MTKKKIGKVFLENLPRNGYGIAWRKCIGHKVKFVYNDIKGEMVIIDYIPKGQKLIIEYNNKKFTIKTCNLIDARLGKLLNKHTYEFKIEMGTHFKDGKRDLVIIDRKYVKDKRGRNWKMYKYKCNKCGFECGEHYKDGEFKKELWTLESGLIQGNGCACCCNPPQVIEESVNSIVANPETHWMIKYFQEGYDGAKKYTPQSNQKIKLKCPDCGKEKNMSTCDVYKIKSMGCTCGDGFSYGHKYVYSLLTQLNLKFEDNKTFNWCKFQSYKDKNKQISGEYDFVIEDMKLIIEVDGGWHRQDNLMSGKTKEESKYLDDMKDLLAKQHNYKVVRITDEDDIGDNILSSELVDIFNLNNINWLKIEEFALSNRVKEACELKKNNQDMTTRDISKLMNLNQATIIRYLKQGKELGWCEYDPKEESIKSGIKSGKMAGKKVEIFKDGISLGNFYSCNELERQSEELFGVRLLSGKISVVANGKRPHHKGYTFKYV